MMPFQSVLWKVKEDQRYEDYPEFMKDIRLDTFFESMLKGYEAFKVRLKSYILSPSSRPENIYYRQGVFKDLEDNEILNGIEGFISAMARVKGLIAISGIEGYSYPYQKERRLLDASLLYVNAVLMLYNALKGAKSEALTSLRDYIEKYIEGNEFKKLKEEARSIKEELDAVEFHISIVGDKVYVEKCKGKTDYSEELAKLFSKFGSSLVEVKEERKELEATHVESFILELVAKLFPEPFKDLKAFYQRNRDFVDKVLENFYVEIHFYISYIRSMKVLKGAGLPFCYPSMTNDKGVYAKDSFDIELASRLVKEMGVVVTNSFEFSKDKRIIVVTGPNSGGKTTFAKMIAQAHYLASLGFPVPGKEARLYLFDSIFTHFERPEEGGSLVGRLESDLYRIKEILERATERSIIIINEMFSSTTSFDALFLGKEIIKRLSEIGSLCVYVTFLDELSRLDSTESYVALVDEKDPSIRTYKVVKKPAEGLAYALAIAKKYGLTTDEIVGRI